MSIDIKQIAEQAGIRMNLWNMGAASMAYSDGCEGVTREHLERFAELLLAAKTTPLTPGELQKLWSPYAGAAPFSYARAVERAHGIG